MSNEYTKPTLISYRDDNIHRAGLEPRLGLLITSVHAYAAVFFVPLAFSQWLNINFQYYGGFCIFVVVLFNFLEKRYKWTPVTTLLKVRSILAGRRRYIDNVNKRLKRFANGNY